MEQRKLIQHGLSSLTVALPAPWIHQRGLKKGDSVFVEEQGNRIILSTDQSVKFDKTSVDVTGLDRTSLLLSIQSLYRYGFNEIELHFSTPTIVHHRTGESVNVSSVVHLTVNRLVGAEIIEQSDKRILIKYLAVESEEDFSIVLRRIFVLLLQTADSLLEAIKKDDKAAIASIEEQHDNITKFVSYALRLLNKRGYPDVKKTCFYFHIIASLDKIADILKYNARSLQSQSIGKPATEVWATVNRSLRLYYELFYSFDLKTVNSLGEQRDTTKNVLSSAKKLSADEIILLTRLQQIQEILLDLTEFRYALEQ